MKEKRAAILLLALALIAAACAGAEERTPTTDIAPTTTSSPATTTTTTSSPTTFEAAPDLQLNQPVLAANGEGVFQVDADGDVSQLVSGRAVYAVDDARGGLLFQRERGRDFEERSAWDATVVWWIPAGATTPRELLVPTPGSGHELSLHDAFATEDGFAVLYIRHESDHPVDELVDSLRRYDYPSDLVTELYSQGAWEQGYGEISTNGDLISGVTYGQVSSGCFILDIHGDPTDLVPATANDPVREDQIGGCALTPEGDTLGFTRVLDDPRTAEIHLWEIGGKEVLRRSIPIAGRWGPGDLDIGDGQVLLNRQWEGMYEPALVLDVNRPEADPVELPIPGRTRFVTARVDIPQLFGEVDYYRYGEHGLFQVVDGVEERLVDQHVVRAIDDRMGGVIYWLHPDLDPGSTYRLSASGSIEPFPYQPRFVAVMDGRPTAVETVGDSDDEAMDLRLIDLITGDVARIEGSFYAGDGWEYPTSYGGGLFVGVAGHAVGCGYSDSAIVFWDDEGSEIDHQHNPAPTGGDGPFCGPCELSVAISPDGRHLAYTFRAEAPSELHGSIRCGPGGTDRDDWWESTQSIPGRLAVIDLESGAEVFETTTGPQAAIADFDGRHVVIEESRWWSPNWPSSLIYDTPHETPPVQVSGQVTLVRSGHELLTVRDDGLGVVSFGQPVDEVMAVLTELLGPPDWTEVQIDVETDFSAEWNDPHLYLQFTDWDYFDAAPEPPGPMPGGPVFHYYLTQSDELATEKGIAVGSSVAALKEAYPGVRFFEGCAGPGHSSFAIDASSEWPNFAIFGLLDGDPNDPTTRIVHIGAGWDRTPC